MYFWFVLLVILWVIFLINRVNLGFLGCMVIFSIVVLRLLVLVLKGIECVMMLGCILSLFVVVVELVKVIMFCLSRWLSRLLGLLVMSCSEFLGRMFDVMMLCIICLVR